MSMLAPLFNGLMLGSLYGLFGLGLALSFGIMRVVNIAHGEFVVLSAYLGAVLLANTGLSVVEVVPLVVLCAFAAGWLLQSALLNRIVGANPVPGMIVTMGLSIIIRSALVTVFGAGIRSIDLGGIQDRGMTLCCGVSVGVLPVLVFGVAILAFVALHLMLTRTSIGRAFRAAADDAEMIETLGFDRRRIYSAAMGLAVALAALAGLLLAMQSSFSPYAGVERLLLSFEVVIIGGLGSLRGAFLGGVTLGIVQVVGLSLDSDAGPLFQHVAFFVVLLWRQIPFATVLRWRSQ
ncbi:branched-chain amino acid ABC transporter permease [Paraburkholderia ferrariae]|uniref:branched-chain amino acid ABC transporter permease n=1 Tax=Paraburkholderia ferrariae TaxID=386056 RepID=UPI00047FD4C3|nr:branched-chain amino acid ABC transporter permease [Paraburkholderia ferrariae]